MPIGEIVAHRYGVTNCFIRLEAFSSGGDFIPRSYNHAQKSIARKVTGPGIEPVVIFVLNGHADNFFLNVYVHDQRPGLLSTPVKEVSFYSRHQ